MTDLELSEKVVADVLVKLFEHGLRGLDIEEPTDATDAIIDTGHLMNLMLWLEREGLVAFEFIDASSLDGREGQFMQTVLTSRGFAAMGHQFGDTPEETVGQAAEKISAGEGSFVRAGSFVGGLLGGLTKALSQ